MDSPKISVIIPVYNLEKDIERCLYSVLAQSYSNLEIIAVDDGSLDRSAYILDDYSSRHSNLSVIHQVNGGVTAARLKGISMAAGDWIGFVDGDDYIEPHMFHLLLKNAQEHDADISHCGYQMVFDDGRVHYFHNTGSIVEQDTVKGLADLLDGSMVEPGLCNKLYRRELFDSILEENMMDPSIKINEDLLMNVILFRQARKAVFHDVCPYHYIVRGSSASRQKLNENKIFDPIRVRKAVLGLVPDELKSVAKKAYINSCLDSCNGILLAGRNEYKAEFEQVCHLLAVEKESFSLIGKKRAYMAKVALSMPGLYGVLYRIYARHFQKKVYD